MLTSAIPDIQTKFAGTVQLIGKNAYDQTINSGGTVAEAQYAAQVAIASTYHAGLVSTACINATRQFFDQEFNSI